MFYVGIFQTTLRDSVSLHDIAKEFSVCSVINDKEEMIIKPFPFNSTAGGFKKSWINIIR